MEGLAPGRFGKTRHPLPGWKEGETPWKARKQEEKIGAPSIFLDLPAPPGKSKYINGIFGCQYPRPAIPGSIHERGSIVCKGVREGRRRGKRRFEGKRG
ncbi:MAG: hypothetical protein D6795_07885 [Deltaproteobacteria bacterium]|nr:MAG: hypothetical protein D6795_07885 [Deltaproteobacteria bacterium]